jgi:uncharacterized protein YoxC
MVFGLFGQKKNVEKLRTEVQDSFEHVRRDVNKISDWIRHLDDKKEKHNSDIDDLKQSINSIQDDINDMKNTVSFFGQTANKQNNKHKQTPNTTQTNDLAVQTGVQTAVQTADLDKLTVMERAVVFTLINTDLKFSYEDLAVTLGKKKSTIRGQINTIKQKIPGLLEEKQGLNGKKRVFIEENNKKGIVKRAKIKINP